MPNESVVIKILTERSNPDGANDFLFSGTSIPGLGPTQPPAQRLPGFLTGKKRPGRHVEQSPRSFTWLFLPFVHVVFKFVSCVLLLVLSCVLCDCCWLAVCIVVVVLYMCCYLICICCTFFFTLDAGLLTRSQYSEGPATGYLDTCFSWFPFVYNDSQDSKLPLHASHVALPT